MVQRQCEPPPPPPSFLLFSKAVVAVQPVDLQHYVLYCTSKCDYQSARRVAGGRWSWQPFSNPRYVDFCNITAPIYWYYCLGFISCGIADTPWGTWSVGSRSLELVFRLFPIIILWRLFFLVVLQYFQQDASALCQLTDCTHWFCKTSDNSVFANLSKNIDLIWSCWWRQDGGWWWWGVGDAHSSISLHRPSSGNIQSGNWAASFHWVYCKHWTFLKAQAPHTLVWQGLDVILALHS